MKVINAISYRLGLNKFFGKFEKYENTICHFDTSITSLNVGDEIINDSGSKQIKTFFSDKQILKAATHDKISSRGIHRANLCECRLVCGSNILTNNLLGNDNWNISPLEILRLNKLILMGVGWNKYNEKVGLATKVLYRMLLSKEGFHSVRDEYTKEKLAEIGINNVINTGCPTMWGLTPEHCNNVPVSKARSVVFTLTDYGPSIERDKELIKVLTDNYEKLYFWPQGNRDMKYLHSLGIKCDDIVIIPPQLSAFDNFLSKNDVDFIGTRLHGGIRALQHKRRTLIVAIDNRAIEKGKDFNLPVIHRDDVANKLQTLIDGEIVTKIKLKTDNIEKWKGQFHEK
ncbi:polysaccharide pyruvyl transferase family protein [Vibrio sp. B513a]|uniref:polysaccharide pyruvyl transferase family protein n=1 Tax=Vibrio sp. B513a TaxID=2836183 RepID=UPI00255361EE|nr:polysaccharide pyruvyl transferase family protein [Vibrio sp. B513a]MDK9750026.1 polysaccharide pyruvyl transferase family protein [Vibrio sp. B513a]